MKRPERNGCISSQDYKSLRVAVMIRATLVNTLTHTVGRLLTSYTISSAAASVEAPKAWRVHLANAAKLITCCTQVDRRFRSAIPKVSLFRTYAYPNPNSNTNPNSGSSGNNGPVLDCHTTANDPVTRASLGPRHNKFDRCRRLFISTRTAPPRLHNFWFPVDDVLQRFALTRGYSNRSVSICCRNDRVHILWSVTVP